MSVTIPIPLITRPNTTCLPSRCGQFTATRTRVSRRVQLNTCLSPVVMKNCDPFVSGPALAMDSWKDNDRDTDNSDNDSDSHHARALVLQSKVFVLELGTVNALSARAVTVLEVSA